ncbi:MAG: hypothetical protein FJ222_06855 [Lentisphaerae bacterium]|nr:hypothetical protein [Lentisphaerota bacterium]
MDTQNRSLNTHREEHDDTGCGLGRFSIGVGDRFGCEGVAQLAALAAARRDGIRVTPVWNKSNREHTLIGTCPSDARAAADAAVREAGWSSPYWLDADHISLGNVDRFLDACDFFTLDVAEQIGQACEPAAVEALAGRVEERLGLAPALPGTGERLPLDRAATRSAAGKYAAAVAEAGRIFRRIRSARGSRKFLVEVSLDETDTPQSPQDLLVILTGLAAEGVPVDTLAPRFSGRFNKGVDYVGDPRQFAREFELDVSVLALAWQKLGFGDGLKLSVHSGSDKFAIYGPIRDILARTGAGLHLKTAGTTWLEELVGLALVGGDALAFVKDLWRQAVSRREELSKPYATVLDIDPARLPTPEEVNTWDGPRFAAALRHDSRCPHYDPHFRQLLHVAFRLAAEAGDAFYRLLHDHRATIAREVTLNLLDRHVRSVFPSADHKQAIT